MVLSFSTETSVMVTVRSLRMGLLFRICSGCRCQRSGATEPGGDGRTGGATLARSHSTARPSHHDRRAPDDRTTGKLAAAGRDRAPGADRSACCDHSAPSGGARGPADTRERRAALDAGAAAACVTPACAAAAACVTTPYAAAADRVTIACAPAADPVAFATAADARAALSRSGR